ncbi:MAG: hypothetical protein ACXW25_06795, partial [Rhodospirillales bacterium]
AIQRRGVRVTIVSTIRSKPPMVADELRRQADNFVELLDLQPSIQRILPGREDRNNQAQQNNTPPAGTVSLFEDA